MAGLGPVTPNGIVFQEQQLLRCVDPLSGETLWLCDDVPMGSELFGDGNFLVAANVDEGKTQVIDMVDGELVATRDLPAIPWLLTAGRNVAQLLDETIDANPRKDPANCGRRHWRQSV